MAGHQQCVRFFAFTLRVSLIPVGDKAIGIRISAIGTIPASFSCPYPITYIGTEASHKVFKKIAALIAIAKGLLIATSETLILCCSSSETFLQVLAVRDGLLVFLLFHGRSKRRWHLFGQAIEVNQASETKLATAPGSGIELSSCPSD